MSSKKGRPFPLSEDEIKALGLVSRSSRIVNPNGDVSTESLRTLYAEDKKAFWYVLRCKTSEKIREARRNLDLYRDRKNPIYCALYNEYEKKISTLKAIEKKFFPKKSS